MTNTQELKRGDVVDWLKGHTTATVLRIGPNGSIVIRPTGDRHVIVTRACFVLPVVTR